MFIIMEIFDRELVQVETRGTREEAIKAANDMLEHCARDCGFDEPLQPDGEPFEYQFASDACLNAWANIKDHAFDAHIAELKG